ncbi:hypothetical protein BDF19DRAFT_426722 [Syncephalis fuscata]|nr:hypothetical protein BDF19DRAFT_426722 [Syncephalis fuscata]
MVTTNASSSTSDNHSMASTPTMSPCAQLSRMAISTPVIATTTSSTAVDSRAIEESVQDKENEPCSHETFTFMAPIELTSRVTIRLVSALIKTLLHLRGQMPCIWTYILDELRRNSTDPFEEMNRSILPPQYRKAEQFVQGAETWFAAIQQYVTATSYYSPQQTSVIKSSQDPIELCIVLGFLSSPKEVYHIRILGSEQQSNKNDEEPTERQLIQCERRLIGALMNTLTQSISPGLGKLYLLMKSRSDDDQLPPSALLRRTFQPELIRNRPRIMYKSIILDGQNGYEEEEEKVEQAEDATPSVSKGIWFQLSPVLTGLPPWSTSNLLLL